jgi:hypothetical protein
MGIANVPDPCVTSSKEVAELSFVVPSKRISVSDYANGQKNKAAIAFFNIRHFRSSQGPAIFGAKGRRSRGDITVHFGGVLSCYGFLSLPQIHVGVFDEAKIFGSASVLSHK